MSETNPTPVEAIPFALVDESGHLTGKPAEGVAAMIQAATEDLKAKLTEATATAGIDEAAVEKIITDHENDILKAWQADKTFAEMVKRVRDRSVWKDTPRASRPGDFWYYLLSVLNASFVMPFDGMGSFSAAAATGLLDDWGAGQLWAKVEEIGSGYTDWLDSDDATADLGLSDYMTYGEGKVAQSLIFWAATLETIAKLADFKEITLEGKAIKLVTKAGKTFYIQLLTEKPGA